MTPRTVAPKPTASPRPSRIARRCATGARRSFNSSSRSPGRRWSFNGPKNAKAVGASRPLAVGPAVWCPGSASGRLIFELRRTKAGGVGPRQPWIFRATSRSSTEVVAGHTRPMPPPPCNLAQQKPGSRSTRRQVRSPGPPTHGVCEPIRGAGLAPRAVVRCAQKRIGDPDDPPAIMGIGWSRRVVRGHRRAAFRIVSVRSWSGT